MAPITSTQTTLMTAAGTKDSAERYGCPGVHAVAGHDERFVITREVGDPETLAALAPYVGVDSKGHPEHVGAAPPWVPCQLMDLATLERFMDDHLHQQGDSVFRAEGLPLFNVASDPNWQHWQAGATEPDWTVKQAWLDELADHTTRGIRHYRVRLFDEELSEHEIYECNWGYALNVSAGEEIRVLRRGEHELPHDLIEAEYWIVNDSIAIGVLYDRHGRFRGAGWLGPEESAEYLRDRYRMWQAAEPFAWWWARHPEFHRSRRLVA